MPDELQIYQSDLTGPELDEALRNIGKVQQSVADAAQSAATAEQYGAIVQQNQQAIQEIHDNLTVIEAAPGNAQAAQTAAAQAAASATQAAGSAADAAQSAEDAQAAAQQALGFRTFFDAISPDESGSLDPSRPMTTASAKAAWTVRSEGDMLRSVEVFGFTSGGDFGAGFDAKKQVPADGWDTVNGIFFNDSAMSDIAESASKAYSDIGPCVGTDISEGSAAFVAAADGYTYAVGFNFVSGTYAFGRMYIKAPYTTVQELQEWLTQSPKIVAIEAASGLRVPVRVQGHSDNTAEIPLTKQLRANESVQSYVDSGCDAYIEFDGSEDENWEDQNMGQDIIRYRIHIQGAKDADVLVNHNPAVTNWLSLTYIGGTSDGKNKDSFLIASDALFAYTDGGPLVDFKARLAENPLKLWYTSKSPTGKKYYVSMERHAYDIVYSHNPVEITADPYTDADTGGEPGTYTVSSEDGTTVKVTLKALTENAKADTAVQPGDILDLVYPVGSIYMSCNATSPGALFGGTWERIEGRFLFAADDQHQAGSTGGSAAVTLTAQNIPQITGQLGYCDGGFVPANGYARSVIKHQDNGGGGLPGADKSGYLSDRDPAGYYASSLVRMGTSSPSSISILPPYLAVYIWRRTA